MFWIFSFSFRTTGVLPSHLWPDWSTSPSPWTTFAGACQTAALWPTSPTATWWICRGRPHQAHQLLLLPPQPQRGGSPRASQASLQPRAHPLAQPLVRPQAQGASSAPSPAWWRVHRWPRTWRLPRMLSQRRRRRLLKAPLQEVFSQPSLWYASLRSCWWLMISTQTGERKPFNVVAQVWVYIWAENISHHSACSLKSEMTHLRSLQIPANNELKCDWFVCQGTRTLPCHLKSCFP